MNFIGTICIYTRVYSTSKLLKMAILWAYSSADQIVFLLFLSMGRLVSHHKEGKLKHKNVGCSLMMISEIKKRKKKH